MSEIEELIWSTDQEDRWRALEGSDLTTDHLEVLSVDPVAEIADTATNKLRERGDSPPLKIVLQSYKESKVGIKTNSILHVDFRNLLFHGEWPFQFEFPAKDQVLPGDIVRGFAYPHYEFKFNEGSIYLVGSPGEEFYGEVEILSILDDSYKK